MVNKAAEQHGYDHSSISSGLKFRDSFHMSSFISSSLKDDCSKSKMKGAGQMGSSLISWRGNKNGWFKASSTAQISCEKEHNNQEKKKREKCSVLINIRGIPVMRLLGSKTSIFSTRSMAIGDMLGNFSEKGCFGTQGSCLTYFLALSLLRNPRSESSGEPNSYFGITRKIFISDHHNKIHRINTMPIYATCPDIFYK